MKSNVSYDVLFSSINIHHIYFYILRKYQEHFASPLHIQIIESSLQTTIDVVTAASWRWSNGRGPMFPWIMEPPKQHRSWRRQPPDLCRVRRGKTPKIDPGNGYLNFSGHFLETQHDCGPYRCWEAEASNEVPGYSPLLEKSRTADLLDQMAFW